MTVHLYLSLIPEALIASMLTPEEFGAYYAVGSEKKSRGQAIFFEIDPNSAARNSALRKVSSAVCRMKMALPNDPFIFLFTAFWKIFP